MPELELNDAKGDYWHLLVGAFRENKKGLAEMHCIVSEGPHELRHYDVVPLPVFTDWWPL